MIIGQIITIFLILALLIAQDNVDNIYSQFVQYKQVQLRKYVRPQNLSPQKITFSPAFENPPQILTGIIVYNNRPNFLKTDFSVSGEQVSNKDCQLTLNYDETEGINQNDLYSLTVSFLAIDTKQIPNIFVSKVIKLVFDKPKNQGNDLIQEFTFPYTILNQVGERDVALFLNGFSSIQYNKRKFNLLLEKEIGVDSFKIKVTSKQDSATIRLVYVQYIEYVQSSTSNFFATIINDEGFKQGNPKLASSQDGQVSTAQQIQTITQNKQYKLANNLQNVHFGINQLYLDHTIDARLKMDVRILIDYKLQIEYSVWDTSTSQGVTSTSIFIGMKACFDKNKYYFSNNCFKDCLDANNQIVYYNTSQCLCKQPLYYYPSSHTTAKTQLISNYCEPIQSICYLCQPCTDINCAQCLSNQDSCELCLPGYYFFNKQCKSCELIGCSECNDPASKPHICISCQPNWYKWQDKCQLDKPSNAYCDDKSQCKSCELIGCNECNDPASKPHICISCQPNWYKWQDKCQQEIPTNAYCDDNKECKSCELIGCNECNDPASKPHICISCLTNWYKLQDKCQLDKPSNAYCDDNKQCKSCNSNNVINCAICTDPDQTSTFKCLACQQGFYSFNSQCLDKQPRNTYCIKRIINFENF